MEQKFTKIYEKNTWGKGSGTGSKCDTPDNRFYLSILKDIIEEREIKTICDVGCGDWEIMKSFDLQGKEYLGLDVVESVITKNSEDYKKDNIKFERQDVTQDPIRGFDLVILKDVIQHWADEDIVKTLDELMAHNKYVFITNGYKFLRDKTKNEWETRVLDKKYHYHPVDICKEPLKRYHNSVLSETKRRAKQMILFRQI